MSDGYLLLVTDRLDGGEALSRTLGEAMDVRVVGMGRIQEFDPSEVRGVLADINMKHSDSLAHLQRALRMPGARGAPMMSMLRHDTEDTFLQARGLGARICLKASTPARSVTQAVVQQAYPGESIVDRIVNRGLNKSIDSVGAALTAANGGGLDLPKVDGGIDPVLSAIKHGGLGRWLDGVWVHDDVTYRHCMMVAGLAAAVCLDLGFNPGDQQRFVRSALLHDLGKASIPHAILSKPGRLTDDEREVMKTHSRIGYDLLVGEGVTDKLTLDVALHHHEMIDGSGYPDRLRGDGISDPVRLMTICDIYAALVEKRPYKDPMTPDEAFRTLAGMGDKLEQSMVVAVAKAVLSAYQRKAAAA